MKKPKTYRPNTFKSGKSYKSTFRKERESLYKTKEWVKYRFRFLHYNPLCYVCGEKASVVDHIVAAKLNVELFKDIKNHCPMCARCHNTVTTLFDIHTPPKTEEKLKWIADKRASGNVEIRVKVLDRYE